MNTDTTTQFFFLGQIQFTCKIPLAKAEYHRTADAQ